MMFISCACLFGIGSPEQFLIVKHSEGGGQPHYAQAGGKNKDGLSAAVDKVVELAQL